MAQNQLERQLVAGVRAARQGNRERARELLEGVLKRDRENEQAWIWMASIVSSTRERRICLERVLKVNPSNRAARAAINSMVGVIGGEAANIDFEAMSRAAKTPLPSGGQGRTAATTGTSPAAGGRGGQRRILPLLIGAAVILGLIFVATLVIPMLTARPEPTATAVAVVVETTPEVTEEDDGSTPVPTATFTPVSIATIAPRDDLPTEMIIPTETLVPTDVPTVTPTISSVSNYNFVFLAVEGSLAPILYKVSGDTTGLEPLASNLYDMDVSSNGVLAFTREVQITLPTPTPSSTPTPNPRATAVESAGTAPQPPRTAIINKLFVSTLNNPLEFLEISNETYTNAFSPSISPNGQQIAFASDADGDDDIYIYDIPSRTIRRVTNSNGFSDIDPDWSPDGKQMVFASDRETPGRYDLYTLTLGNDVEGSIVRITKTRRGNNISPQWSPVGNHIVYRNQDNSNATINMVNMDNGAIRALTFQTNQIYSDPSWTADGIYVVYSSDSAGLGALRQIFLVNPETLFSQFIRLDGIDVKMAIARN